MIARQAVLRAGGKQMSLETPGGTVSRAGPVRAEAEMPLKQEKGLSVGARAQRGLYQLYVLQRAMENQLTGAEK